MLAGVSGLQASQEMLNVVGNNLANMNTTGYKAQNTLFSDLLYQTLVPASSTNNGGTINPVEVGFGTQVSTIETNLNQGALTTTGSPLDLALQGQGFFIASTPSGNLFTRDGAFGIDANGFLVDPATGYRIQRTGTVGEATATSPGFQTPGVDDIQIPTGTGVPGHATANVTLQGNLSANANGPQAQTLTTATPFTSGGAPATTATTLNSLSDNVAPYQAGDSIVLQGTTTAGATVNITVPVSPTYTLGNLLSAINTNFPGSTATLDSKGNLVVTANTNGPSKLQLSISDAAGNKGASAWSAHGLQVTATGQNGATVNGAIQVYDTQGTPHNLSLTFQKQGPNTWNLTASIPAADGTMITNTVSGITFNSDGSFRQITGPGTISFQINGLAAPQTITFNFGTPSGVRRFTVSSD
jgi:flagellar hook protein FlgE